MQFLKALLANKDGDSFAASCDKWKDMLSPSRNNSRLSHARVLVPDKAKPHLV